jgi:hypothetical protein
MSDSPGSGGPSSERLEMVRLAKGQEVSLGCGTLILIALIVLFCSGRGTGHRDDLRWLERELSDLRRSVDAQSAEIRLLREKLLTPPKGADGKEMGGRKEKE